MSEAIKEIEHKSRMSFFDKAVWFVFLTPLVFVFTLYTSVIGIQILAYKKILSISSKAVYDITQVGIIIAIVIEFLCLIFAIVICCTIWWHKRKFTILIALLAILTSCFLGYFTVIAYALNQYYGHN